MYNNSPVVIIMAVKNQSPCRSIHRTRWWRKLFNNSLKKIINAFTSFCRNQLCIRGIKSQIMVNLMFYRRNISRRQINFINNRHNFKVMLQSHVHIAHCLRFNALACINQKQSTFTRSNRSGNFV